MPSSDFKCYVPLYLIPYNLYVPDHLPDFLNSLSLCLQCISQMAVAVAFYTSSFASLRLEYYSSDDFKKHFLCEVEHELDLSLIL